MYTLLKRWLIILLVGLWCAIPSLAHAANCEEITCNKDSDNYQQCLNEKISCLSSAVNDKQKEGQTLNNAISILNGTIRVQELQISQTEAEIDKLEKEIADLGTRIHGLEISLDQMTNVLVSQVDANYKLSQQNKLLLLLASNSFTGFINEQKYLQAAQSHLSDVMKQAENQRVVYDNQKQLKTEKQTEIAAKRDELEKQRRVLNTQKVEKQQLLTVTQNDEKRYQSLLADAKAEVASLKSFVANKGGGALPPQQSPDGWYFSQRDERWAYSTIGASKENMFEVGCLVSSTAMIKKKFGEDVTPLHIAANNSYFFSNTAYMLKPWPAPSGYRYIDVSYSQSRLDAELEKNPVIVKLLAGAYGTHFIVIKEKQGDKYIMHDPWEGYDKNFTDYYSFGQINRISYLQGS